MQTTNAQRITALYERLSKDDDVLGDSNSIINQKRILEDYAAKNGFCYCAHYTDDGYSGGSFNRPGWKKLIKDIEAGIIQTVIAKDMSRVGRNYLETGYYTEVFFRQHNVRFIAISNNVDSEDRNSGEFAPFLNIMNEWYIRDCSRKMRATYKLKSKAGKTLTNNVIYGYKKSQDEKGKWIIDEEAADVVRKIFKMSIEGLGSYKIARILQEQKIQRPSYYLALRGQGTQRTRIDMARPYDWVGATVTNILSKQEYAGHTVNYRTISDSYKDKRRKKNPESEWQVIRNTHDAIVDDETWELAQQTRRVVHRYDSEGKSNPLTGLVYCADCGCRLYNHRGRKKVKWENAGLDPQSGLYPYDFYDCSTYTLSLPRADRKCSSHYIPTKTLRELIRVAIQSTCEAALGDEKHFIELVKQQSKTMLENEECSICHEYEAKKERDSLLDNLLKNLYEAYSSGKITEKRFLILSKEYEEEQSQLEIDIDILASKIASLKADESRAEKFIALAKKYTDFSILTTPLIYEFVEKIIVHKARKSKEKNDQDIEIVLKYLEKPITLLT